MAKDDLRGDRRPRAKKARNAQAGRASLLPASTQEKQRAQGQGSVSGERAERRAVSAPAPASTQEKLRVKIVPGGGIPAGRQDLQPWQRRRTDQTQAQLGLETTLDTVRRLEAAGHATAAKALRGWLNRDTERLAKLVAMLPDSRSGVPRDVRIGLCGVPIVARRGEVVKYVRRACKDRFCPDCGARRRRRFVARLREIVATRPPGFVRYFVTLTQPKLTSEHPRAAMNRVLSAFKRFRKNGKGWLVGGVRSLEVTSRKKGWKAERRRKRGEAPHEVRSAGIHAHLHVILEVRAGTTPDQIWAAWEAASAGSARAAFDCQLLDDESVHQVGDYVVDMSSLVELLDSAPGYVAKVLEALHGRRLVASFGEWIGLDLGMRESKGDVVFGDRTVHRLASNLDDYTVKFADGSTMSPAECLERLRASDGQPFGCEAAAIDAILQGEGLSERQNWPGS